MGRGTVDSCPGPRRIVRQPGPQALSSLLPESQLYLSLL